MPPVTSTSMSTSASAPASATFRVKPPALSHFVIFNPTIQLHKANVKVKAELQSGSDHAPVSHQADPSKHGDGQDNSSAEQAQSNSSALGPKDEVQRKVNEGPEPETQDKDEQDDLREAAQILFYTSRDAGGVSRDKMLRQVGLAKGLMGFADMLVKDETKTKFWSIHGHRSRLLLFTPEKDFFFYINITLAHREDEKKDPVVTSQGLSDEMLVDVLTRGYEEFRLLHGPLHTHLPASPAFSSLLDRYFTRFAFQFESEYLSTSPTLSSWIAGRPAPSLPKDTVAPIRKELLEASHLFIVGPDGPLYLYPAAKECDGPLLKYLHKLVQASLPPPHLPPPITPSTTSRPPTDGRQMLVLNFGLPDLGIGSSRKPATHGHARTKRDGGGRKTSWATLGGWVPDIRRSSTPVSSPSLSTEAAQARTPVKAATEADIDDNSKGSDYAKGDKAASSASKWGFGLGGLGDAFGGVGTALGLAGPSRNDRFNAVPTEQSPPTGASARKEHVVTSDQATEISHGSSQASALLTQNPPDALTPNAATVHSIKGEEAAVHVEEDKVSIAELEAAAEPDEELEWDRKWVWVARKENRRSREDSDGVNIGYVRRRLRWIVRDNVLIAVLIPGQADNPSASLAADPESDENPSLPSTRTTLDLIARISSTNNPSALSPVSTETISTSISTPYSSSSSHFRYQTRTHGQDDSYVGVLSEDVIVKGGDIDSVSDSMLVDLRDELRSDPTIEEIYAKTPTSKFVVAIAKNTTSNKRSSQAHQAQSHVIAQEEVEEYKGTERKELYMVVGRKDASLTDADLQVQI
ncbi:hypothetical protein I317_06409 [Kwoniella heveanensis CBS 569]|nr:hypothetical protein I317_06409 [Kwoniella heveanensis CBS 569]